MWHIVYNLIGLIGSAIVINIDSIVNRSNPVIYNFHHQLSVPTQVQVLHRLAIEIPFKFFIFIFFGFQQLEEKMELNRYFTLLFRVFIFLFVIFISCKLHDHEMMQVSYLLLVLNLDSQFTTYLVITFWSKQILVQIIRSF